MLYYNVAQSRRDQKQMNLIDLSLDEYGTVVSFYVSTNEEIFSENAVCLIELAKFFSIIVKRFIILKVTQAEKHIALL